MIKNKQTLINIFKLDVNLENCELGNLSLNIG